MKIQFSEKRLKNNLKTSLLFLTMGLIFVLISLKIPHWKNLSIQSIGVGQFSAGVLVLILYFFEKTRHYLKLKDGVLTKQSMPFDRIKLNEISKVKDFGGELKLISERREFIINTQIADKMSLQNLKSELAKYVTPPSGESTKGVM